MQEGAWRLARALITQPAVDPVRRTHHRAGPSAQKTACLRWCRLPAAFRFTALIVSHDIPGRCSSAIARVDGPRQSAFRGAPTDLELVRDPALLEFVHHRNELLSELGGQAGRTALFADWAELRHSYDHFVVTSCATDRRRPGSELGLRRFASYQTAVAAIAALQQKHSRIYFLDERHFGFAIGGEDADALVVGNARSSGNG